MQGIKLPLSFAKMNGAGNDFIVIDHRKPIIPKMQMPEFVRLVCRRRLSVGADGLFFIETSDQADFKWHFFNSDGSEASMCGNGARCVARYAYLQGIAGARMHFETKLGIIHASIAEKEVSIAMTAPLALLLDQSLVVGGQNFVIHSLDTGVPHVVIFVAPADLDAVDLAALGPAIRFHPIFSPRGTNVNFVALTEHGLRMRTYERGVEGETLACGTGAVAAAVVASRKGMLASPVRVRTTGGDTLEVRFATSPTGQISHVQLKGPASLAYWGELQAEALLE